MPVVLDPTRSIATGFLLEIIMQMNHLYAVREFGDVFVDAAVRDELGELVFLSLYGRDTVILQFLATFSLPTGQGGRRDFTLVRGVEQHCIGMAAPEKLQKLTGRLPRNNLFGNLTHTWLYREDAIKPDRVNRRALLLRFDETETAFADRTWLLLRELCPVPLLDHWRQPLMTALGAELIMPLATGEAPPIGSVDGARLRVPESFEQIVSMAVAMGALTLDEAVMPADSNHRIEQAAQAVAQAAHAIGRIQADARHDPRQPLFELGDIVWTQGVQALLESGDVIPMSFICRHERGDWGVSSDGYLNDRAIKDGSRIFSAYPIDPAQPCKGFGENTIWVITEADRSVTTLLLPDEY